MEGVEKATAAMGMARVQHATSLFIIKECGVFVQ
jgi:hypothetical protein